MDRPHTTWCRISSTVATSNRGDSVIRKAHGILGLPQDVATGLFQKAGFKRGGMGVLPNQLVGISWGCLRICQIALFIGHILKMTCGSSLG